MNNDWQRKYERLENMKFTSDEEVISKLNESRKEALNKVKQLDELVKQSQA